jgi:outer membrane beta-barrel protein
MIYCQGLSKRGAFAFLFAFVLAAPLLAQQNLEELESEVLSGSGGSKGAESYSSPIVEEEVLSAPKKNPSVSSYETQSEISEDQDLPFRSSVKSVKSKSADQKVSSDIDELINGPKSIPFSHIFVVKHQYIFKKGRHEIMPFTLGIQPGDSFRRQLSMGLGYLYHLNESFAIEALHLNFFTNLETGFSKNFSKNTLLEIERVEPVVTLGSALQWAPFRGKAATAENIYNFEGYLFAGGGMTQFEVGSAPTIMSGLGARIFMNRRSTLKFEFRDYVDLKSEVGNRFNVVLGAGILLGAPEL